MNRVRYRYRVLGTTQALRADGTSVPLGGARLRALLTALAATGGRPVRTDALVAEVWAADEEPPTDELAALQALIGRLRRALGRDAVASVASGYRLVAEQDDIDLFRFERLADEGAQALADGAPGKALELLEDALALWRGPALADLPEPGAAGVRAQARQLAARRGRLAAECALGRAETALPALRELATAHPLDEPLWALYLRALRDTGRQAEALAAYEEARVTLADRLGADPGPELRALHAELLRSAPADTGTAQDGSGDRADAVGPATPAAPADPADPADRTGAATRAARPVTAQPVTARSGNLRARLTSFVGRETDLSALRDDLSGARLVTLLGPGGAGKTRLSQEAAEAVADAWPDGVWFAELAPVRDPEALAEAVLTALGGRETVLRGTTAEGLRAATDPLALDPLAQLAERCAARRMLLVLDNCEHVVDAAAALVETLLVECPQVTVLATSREPLGVPGEQVRPVEPLPDPWALRLLADRGASARAGFRVQEDPAACAEICRRLDGLPLAIELAAARLRSLTPRQIADRLDDRFRLLTNGSRTVLPRQQALRAVVDWSWDLLDDAERAVLRRLAVFSGSCGLGQAEEICADPAGSVATDSRDVAALLGALVDKSLVVAAPAGDGGMRYRLLETVGEYAAERLDEAGERPATERRHLIAYRELARTTDALLRGPGQRESLEQLERDHDNLRTALRRAVAARDEHEACCLVLSMHWFWELRGHRTDAGTWSRAVLELGPDPFLPPVTPAPSLRERCTDRPPPMSPDQLAEARRSLWLIHFANTQPDMAVLDSPEMREQLEVLAATYQPGQPQVCRPPGISWFFAMILTGDHDRLAELLDAAVRGSRELGDEWALAGALQLRSKVLNDWLTELDRAARDADESLEIFTRLGDQWGVAEALAGRGEVRERHGDLPGAAEDYRRAGAIAVELGANAQVPMLRARLAGVLMEAHEDIAEQGEDAERMLYDAVEAGERAGGDTGHFARVALVVRLGRVGRVAEAREHLLALRERLQGAAPPLFFGMIEGLDGWLDVRAGRPQEALAKLRDATTVMMEDPLTQTVAPQITIWQLVSMAEALAALGRSADAARLLGSFDAHGAPSGSGSIANRESRVRAEEMARAGLGDEEYERLHREGDGLRLAEAVTLMR